MALHQTHSYRSRSKQTGLRFGYLGPYECNMLHLTERWRDKVGSVGSSLDADRETKTHTERERERERDRETETDRQRDGR